MSQQLMISKKRSLESSSISSPSTVPVSTKVPAFLNKLYNMVCDPSTDNLIHWSENGLSFIVTNQSELANQVLPRFFKHNNFSSFVRQLYRYGFHKVPHIQQGSLLNDLETEEWEFSNPNFQRNHPDLLCFVTRKKAAAGTNLLVDEFKEQNPSTTTVVDLNQVINEIAAIKRHQITISSDLKSIQRDNQQLWADSLTLRERYAKQQDTIDKILSFLASIFSSKKSVGQGPLKKRKLELQEMSHDESFNTSMKNPYQDQSFLTSIPSSSSQGFMENPTSAFSNPLNSLRGNTKKSQKSSSSSKTNGKIFLNKTNE